MLTGNYVSLFVQKLNYRSFTFFERNAKRKPFLIALPLPCFHHSLVIGVKGEGHSGFIIVRRVGRTNRILLLFFVSLFFKIVVFYRFGNIHLLPYPKYRKLYTQTRIIKIKTFRQVTRIAMFKWLYHCRNSSHS